MEYYAKDCELVIALVSPVGVNLEDVQSRLSSIFPQFGYDLNIVHLSKVSEEVFPTSESMASGEYERLQIAMKRGTELREKYKRGDLYALLAVDEISSKRADEDGVSFAPLPRTVHLIRSLKHPDEVETLRSVYGNGFFLLGVTAGVAYRKHYLKDLKGVESDDEIEALIQRDDKEAVVSGLGQKTRDVFQLADAFVDTDDCDSLSKQLTRIIDLLFSKPVVPPTAEEYAMFMAYTASLRSADLSRQVGAVIVNPYQDIISTGANDVPKSGGGLYWPDSSDQRDYVKGYDFNQIEKRKILEDIVSCLGVQPEDKEEYIKKLNKSRIMDLTEYGRAVHAEMESMLQASRNGVSIRGATLYTTTYPCHNCAKHIVAAGIKEVVYIEPYPKSYANTMHSDSIIDDSDRSDTSGEKVNFRQFVGVGPRHFIDLFSTNLSSGRKLKRKKDGNLVEWSRKNSALRVPMSPLSYLESEVSLVNELRELKETTEELINEN